MTISTTGRTTDARKLGGTETVVADNPGLVFVEETEMWLVTQNQHGVVLQITVKHIPDAENHA